VFTHKLTSDCWLEALEGKLTIAEIGAIESLPKTPLLSAGKLAAAVGLRRASKLCKGVYPEVWFDGTRRCLHIEPTGVRCIYYAESGVCNAHFKEAAMLSGSFKSITLKREYERLMQSPAKMHLDSEVSMMRLMLGIAVGQLKDGAINLEHVVLVTQLCEKISNVVDKMSKMNSITPETIDNMISGMVNIVARYVTADQLALIADEVAQLNPKVNISTVQSLPGEDNGLSAFSIEAEPISIQKRALLEIASTLNVMPSDAGEKDATAD